MIELKGLQFTSSLVLPDRMAEQKPRIHTVTASTWNQAGTGQVTSQMLNPAPA